MYLSVNNPPRNQSKNVCHVTENANIHPPTSYSTACILNFGEGGCCPQGDTNWFLEGTPPKNLRYYND